MGKPINFISVADTYISKNGDGKKYLKSLIDEGLISDIDEKLILVIASIRECEKKIDKILINVI